MKRDVKKIWGFRITQQLAEVLADIDDPATMRNFLRDVMTEKEIIEISKRLEAASMLEQGIKYTEVSKKTKLSSRTVARISDWMQNGCSGYQAALKTVNTHHGHIPPARAE
jgi:TrpR-related protein YerC/YecD